MLKTLFRILSFPINLIYVFYLQLRPKILYTHIRTLKNLQHLDVTCTCRKVCVAGSTGLVFHYYFSMTQPDVKTKQVKRLNGSCLWRAEGESLAARLLHTKTADGGLLTKIFYCVEWNNVLVCKNGERRDQHQGNNITA